MGSKCYIYGIFLKAQTRQQLQTLFIRAGRIDRINYPMLSTQCGINIYLLNKLVLVEMKNVEVYQNQFPSKFNYQELDGGHQTHVYLEKAFVCHLFAVI